MQFNRVALCLLPVKRLLNGSIDSSDEASDVVELQELLEKQNYELAQMKERMSSLSSRVSEVELELETARKDLLKSEEMSNRYQRDNREVKHQQILMLCLLEFRMILCLQCSFNAYFLTILSV